MSAYASGEGWIPIGYYGYYDGYYTERPFSGDFNGNGKTISNLTISRSPKDDDARLFGYTGLFGYIRGGKVQDIGVVDVLISADVFVDCK